MAVTRAQSRIGSSRLTKGYKRTRKAAPSSFKKGSFRTINIGKGKKAVIGKSKKTGEYKVQAILTPRSRKKKWLENFNENWKDRIQV